MAEVHTPFLREFGRRVVRRRNDLQLSSTTVAQAIGMSPSQFWVLERGGQRLMDLEQLARLAEVLQTPVDYLLQRTDERGDVPEIPCRGVLASVIGETNTPVLAST